MTPMLLIRHGSTPWNESGRIQGWADVGLSARGRAEVGRWRLPPAWAGARWLASPLRRARQTAALLTDRPVVVEPRLIEMDWGDWEGWRGADLRARAPAELAAREALGLDFRPPGGESPREVGTRVQALVAELAADPTPVVAVCHKGVIRAALALATGWDMRRKPPVRLQRGEALVLIGHRDGRLELGPASLALAA
jgi:glucosyl-3-phosphoglycerate phosphatase